MQGRSQAKKILIIAGEASGDMHAANLVRDIKVLEGQVSFFGLGGVKMQEAGVNLLENIVHLAFIGPGGLFKYYLKFKKIYDSLCNYIRTNIPDCAILIDFPEFNLRIAKQLKSLGVPVIYYISPQVWAWGLWRIKTIKRLVDKMLVLFKFEEELYRSHHMEATLVGHPLLDIARATAGKTEIIKNLNLSRDAAIVGILPGSRKNEVKKILPVMLQACRRILKEMGEKKIEFILPLAPTIEEDYLKGLLGRSPLDIKIIKDHRYNAISICDCALVASGTATLETALLGVPMAIIYKAGLSTCLLTRSVIRLPYIGLVNVVAGERIVPEFLQYQASPVKIAEYMLRLLRDEELRSAMKERFSKIRISLGEPGASKRAAREVVNFLRGQSVPENCA